MMQPLLFIGNLGMGELLIICLIVLLLFGGKKIPELMKGLGKGVRNFKEGLNDATEEVKKASDTVDTSDTPAQKK